MAVMPMKRISIYALKNRRKQILELIQRRGVVEIESGVGGKEFTVTVTLLEDKGETQG